MRFSFGTWKGVDQEGQLKTDKMKIEGIFFFGYLLQADFLILFPALYVHVSRGTAKYKIISTELGTCVIPIWWFAKASAFISLHQFLHRRKDIFEWKILRLWKNMSSSEKFHFCALYSDGLLTKG